jgi:hypothetical protein
VKQTLKLVCDLAEAHGQHVGSIKTVELDDRQRTVALDLATMVTPRTARFYAAVATLTPGPDIKIAEAVRQLTQP